VSVELDGTVVPIDSSYLLRIDDFPGYETSVLGEYNVWPRFTTTGVHTYVETFEQEEPFFYIRPFEAAGEVDPAPQFEGRRVLVPEQIGDPVDGKFVFRYTLTVVEAPTPVEQTTWAEVKRVAGTGSMRPD
jgi:hypothetical protein